MGAQPHGGWPAARAPCLGDSTPVIPDGMTPRYGALGDAKRVSPTRKSSFYLPDSMGKESTSRRAVAQMDSKLVKLAKAADAFTGSGGIIEIATNHPSPCACSRPGCGRSASVAT